jgi:co-chaperonin GroES (HSP10)
MLLAIADRIIVQLDSADESKILLPESLNTQTNKGVVLSVGPLVSTVREGDHIVFHPFDELKLPEQNLVAVREKSVLAIYKNEK